MSLPEVMQKFRVVAPKKDAYKVVDTLYNLNVFHIQKKAYNGLEYGSPMERAEELSETLVKLRAIKSKLQIKESMVAQKVDDDKAKVERLLAQIDNLSGKVDKAELERARKEYLTLNALKELKIDLKVLDKLKHINTEVGFVSDIESLKAKLEVPHEIVYRKVDEEYLVVIFYKDAKAQDALKDAGFRVFERSGLDYKKLLETKQECSKKLEEIKQKNKDFLLKIEYTLTEEVKKSELPLLFSETKSAFIAQGFVPYKKLSEVRASLENVAAVYTEDEKPGHHDNVPVKLKNKKPVNNFEVLTKLYELPAYFEVDPSVLIFLTFPIFFGLMLGDVVYGFITLAIFALIRWKMPSAKAFMTALMFASMWTILFGFVFGEYLGFEHVSEDTGEKLCSIGICLERVVLESHGTMHVVYDFPRLINRMHSSVNVFGYDLLSVLFIGILVGFVHLNIGLLIGFYNVYRHHGIKMAIYEKLSWILLEIGLILAVASLMGYIVIPSYVGWGMCIVAAVMLYLSEGAKGVIEIPALFSNMLSYMRLGAVGLASVGLAVVVNEKLAMPLMHKGGLWILMAVSVMVLGHLINIMLGVIGSFLHGIRLHYVEFFSKFFSGGGTEYKPFGNEWR